jgi:fucose permease
VTLSIGAIVTAYQPSSVIVLGFMLVGAGNGLIDVYLNVAAQRLEADSGRPVLQWLHASYAFGGITGAAIAGLLRTAKIDFRVGIAYTGVALLITAIWNLRTASSATRSVEDRSAFSISALFRTPALWVPAFVVLSAFLIEGSMDTWSGKYLREQLGSTAGAAAIAFVAFSSALFLGRLFASRALFGLGNRTTIVLAGAGAVMAGLVATLSSEPAVVGVAFLLLGFSLSAATPAGFGLVERYEEDPASAIAAVTTIGYTGFVWSPPILGWVSDTFSLKATMAVIVVATLGIVAGGIAAPKDRPQPQG